MKKKNILLIVLIAILLLACGCGEKNEDLVSFETNLTNFGTNIVSINDALSAIDPLSDSAVSDMLSYLDAMNKQMQLFATLDVPEEFSNIETLADDAALYMDKAFSLYTDAYATDTVDTAILEAADKNYGRAMSRLSYISDLLQGKTPSGEDIVITEGEDTEFDPINE